MTVLLVLTFLPLATAGETSLRLEIQEEAFGRSQQLFFTPTDGNFNVVRQSTNEISAGFSPSSHTQSWGFSFTAPTQAPLSVGFYPEVNYVPGNYPRFSITSGGYGCHYIDGSFQIKQVIYGPSNSILQLWAIFVAHCGEYGRTIVGEIRHNADVTVNVIAPQEKSAERARPLVFTVTATESNHAVVTLTATGLPPGASFTDNRDNSGTFAWVPTFDQAGTFRVRFDGTNGQGASQSVTTTIVVPGETSLSLSSQAGDPVGQGRQLLLTPADGRFSTSTGVTVSFVSHSADRYWTLKLRAPAGQQLKVGTYAGATGKEWPDNRFDPHLSIYGEGACDLNTSTGSFQIKQVNYGVPNQLLSFWATFEQRCAPGQPALNGEIRFNANTVVVHAPENKLLHRGDTLTFNVTATDVLRRSLALSAASLPPGATFTDNRNNTGTFIWTPTSEKKGKFEAVFQADNGLGMLAATTTTITIPGESVFFFDIEPNEHHPQGAQQFFSVPEDGNVRASNFGRQVAISFDTSIYSPLTTIFAAPSGQRLAPGFYADASDSPYQDQITPSLETPSYLGNCSSYGRNFFVKQARYTEAGSIAAFWALFEQTCLGLAPASFGEVRYNADLTVIVRSPHRKFAQAGQPVIVDVAATDIQGRSLALTAVGLPSGATFTDNGNNTGTLRWTPAAEQQGAFTVIFRAENGYGNSDISSTTINIPAQLTIATSANGIVRTDGVVCPGDCGETYPSGTPLFLVAEPARGFMVDRWTGCDSVLGNSCTLRLTQNKTVSVTFTRITYRLTVIANSENGSVSGNGINCPGDCVRVFEEGATVTLSGNPPPNHYASWVGCGMVYGNQCTVYMDTERFVSVSFRHENTLPSRRYFPLNAGLFWTYQVNGICCVTKKVLADKVNINGVETLVVQSDDGYKEYYTNDVFGIRQHGLFDPLSNDTLVFDPPMLLAEPNVKFGSGYTNSSGTLKTSVGDFSYLASYAVWPTQIVNAPMKSFHALSIAGGFTILDLGSLYSTVYLARGVGVIKEVDYADGRTLTIELVATNAQSFSDFDGDGSKEIAIYRNGIWSIQNSAGGTSTISYGGPGWSPVPADYDGDGLLDAAIYNNSGGWSVRYSNGGGAVRAWGGPGWTAAPADYDGDGKADLAVYNAGAWSIARSSDGGNTTFAWGGPAWTPVVGDYDGDGKADIAVYLNGAWAIKRSSDDGTMLAGHGGSEWRPVAGDYDGDGKADIAVYMNGAWSILRSSDNSITVIGHGGPDWVPVPGDYDGDGKTDVAVYHPIGAWSIKRSSDGAIQVVGHGGGPTDVPLN